MSKPPIDIPPHIIEMAEQISRFFEERDIKEWAVGGVRNRWSPKYSTEEAEKVMEDLLNQGTGAYRITADTKISRIPLDQMLNPGVKPKP